MTDLELRHNALVGKLGNEPRDVADMKLGSSVAVNEADISDWAYVQDGVHRGHFTTMLLMQQMPKRIRREAEKVFGWTQADIAA